MKGIFPFLLIGALMLPLSGCSSASAARHAPADTASRGVDSESQELSGRMTELYQISIDGTEKDLASLSSEVCALPVQSRPATAAQETACQNYATQIKQIRVAVDDFRLQIEADNENGSLVEEDYAALIFQCDQLDARLETLSGTLNVVYGLVPAEDTK